jgi:hypothetical protein
MIFLAQLLPAVRFYRASLIDAAPKWKNHTTGSGYPNHISPAARIVSIENNLIATGDTAGKVAARMSGL